MTTLFTVEIPVNPKMTKVQILDQCQPVKVTFKMIATEFLSSKLHFPVADQVADWLFAKKGIGFNDRGVLIAIPEVYVTRWEEAMKTNSAPAPSAIEWYTVNNVLCKQYFWAY